MKRALVGGFLLGIMLALATQTSEAHAQTANRPTSDLQLLTRLNGRASYIGSSQPGADGGTVGIRDGGAYQVIKTQCYAAACVGVGMSCSCAPGQATKGETVAANQTHFMVLDAEPVICTAAVTGSLLPDGGAGAWCDHWLMK